MRLQPWATVTNTGSVVCITFAWGCVTVPCDVIREAETRNVPVSQVLRERYESAPKADVLARVHALREYASKASHLEAEAM